MRMPFDTLASPASAPFDDADRTPGLAGDRWPLHWSAALVGAISVSLWAGVLALAFRFLAA